MASYNIFNYDFRPSKSVERKVFIDLLRFIFSHSELINTEYVGFGSIFYTDMRLIHKELGVNKLVNIERNYEDKKRFHFNRPFKGIKYLWGDSTDVLQDMNFENGKIMWLDYEESFSPYMLEDLETIFASLQPKSFYLFSCNCKLQKFFNKEKQEYDVEKFKLEFPDSHPDNFSKEDLVQRQSPNLLCKIIEAKINSILLDRNSVKEESKKLIFQKLIFLKYQDGAPMMSVGGVLYERGDDFTKQAIASIEKMNLSNSSSSYTEIENAILTKREIGQINRFLPTTLNSLLKVKSLDFIPNEELKKYYTIYRFYPNYIEGRD